MQIDITQFHGIYFDETAEHIAAIEQVLLAIDPAGPSRAQLDQIFRAAHSIKGASATFGFGDLARVTHILESLLGAVREGRLPLSTPIIDNVLQANDLLKTLLDDARAYRASNRIDIDAMCARLNKLSRGTATAAPLPAEAEPFGFFDDEPAAPAAPAGEADEGFGFFADAFEPVADLPASSLAIAAAAVAAETRPPVPAEASSIRVGVERVDQLINLVGELVITQSMLNEAGARLEPALHEQLHRALGLLQRNTRDLQDVVMSIRMLPIAFVFNRFPRLARDLAARLGKQVELTMYGEATELDRSVIEHIADPLTHIVRNSIDHGVELPEARIAAGKPPAGRVLLTAYQQGGSIAVEVSDDGAGLQRERILAKARALGMPLPAEMSDQEVWQLIFAPGFSTAEAVTDVSGRGVGMDVVRRNIQEIGGRIEIESQAGQGTRLTIRLPLTLAIVDGMVVRVGGATYILPLGSIVETLLPDATQCRTVAGAGEVVLVRGEYIPVVALREAFGIAPDPAAAGIVVLVEIGARRAALRVDEILGDRQVVVKSLETNYRKVAGLSGATIMGDGHVALILDVAELIHRTPQIGRP
ncbi:chemotaxis protein CheA [Chitinimonas koreensis]|uniref:chemotaxis protein CheA n=1 Tax=Chitinimonas koreensis TaxID=356302 RepID=UPI000411B3E1|nr:chemotaxis protein CheW [Chitinimonas koreensis]QNM98128.1 chemotaxis protein CheW [Chitinimonas koreensis]